MSQLAEDLNGQVTACCTLLLPLKSKPDVALEVLALATSDGRVELRGLSQAQALSVQCWTQSAPRSAAACVTGLTARCASVSGGQTAALVLAWSTSTMEVVAVELKQ